MINFIERIKDYLQRKDCADMAIRAWKSANKELYANFCKRMDDVGKGNISRFDGYVPDDAELHSTRSAYAV